MSFTSRLKQSIKRLLLVIETIVVITCCSIYFSIEQESFFYTIVLVAIILTTILCDRFIRQSLDQLIQNLEFKQKEVNRLNILLEQKISEQVAHLRANEHQLKESQQRLQFALDGSKDGLWDWNTITNHVYFNDRWLTMLGYNRGDIQENHMSWLELIHPEDIEQTKKIISTHLNNKSSYIECEYRIQTKLGHWTWVLLRGKSVQFDNLHRPIRVAGTHTDINRRKHIEQKLTLASRIFEHLSSGLVITDANGVVESVNPAFTQITGYEPHEIIGKNPSILQSGKQGKEFYSLLWRNLIDHGFWQGELWNRRKNGEIYPQFQVMTAVRNNQGEITQFASIFTDITERKRSEELIRYQAYHDLLTGLPNRTSFYERFNQMFKQAVVSHQMLAVMFLDLDKFKTINDTFGHDVGDELLKEVSIRLKRCIRDSDLVARLAGDEFTVVLSGIQSSRNAVLISNKILEIFSQPVVIEDVVLNISTSIGISIFPEHGDTPDILLKRADQAMYLAKQSGRNNVKLYETPYLYQDLHQQT